MSEALLSSVDILVVNRVEAAMLSGRDVADRESAIAALKELAAPGRSIIVTLGGAGVVVQCAGEATLFVPPKGVEVTSTHGAGDCFIGALAARVAKGDSIKQAATFANHAAADFVSRPN
jgi:ribokinase